MAKDGQFNIIEFIQECEFRLRQKTRTKIHLQGWKFSINHFNNSTPRHGLCRVFIIRTIGCWVNYVGGCVMRCSICCSVRSAIRVNMSSVSMVCVVGRWGLYGNLFDICFRDFIVECYYWLRLIYSRLVNLQKKSEKLVLDFYTPIKIREPRHIIAVRVAGVDRWWMDQFKELILIAVRIPAAVCLE